MQALARLSAGLSAHSTFCALRRSVWCIRAGRRVCARDNCAGRPNTSSFCADSAQLAAPSQARGPDQLLTAYNTAGVVALRGVVVGSCLQEGLSEPECASQQTPGFLAKSAGAHDAMGELAQAISTGELLTSWTLGPLLCMCPCRTTRAAAPPSRFCCSSRSLLLPVLCAAPPREAAEGAPHCCCCQSAA